MKAESGASREITIFADYVCPFSYLSLVGLERVAIDLGLEMHRRSFELRPAPAPAAQVPSDAEWAVVLQLASETGSRIVRPRFQPRTRKAHEAAKFAATLGRDAALARAIYDAHFLDGRDIGRIDVLVEIGTTIGIDATSLKLALDLDAHTDEVLADAALAARLEIEGTPAFVAGSDVRVGFLSEEHLRDWLED